MGQLNSIPFNGILAYSDASRLELALRTKVGGSVVIYQSGRVISKNCIPLSPSLGTFDTEAFSALQAMETAFFYLLLTSRITFGYVSTTSMSHVSLAPSRPALPRNYSRNLSPGHLNDLNARGFRTQSLENSMFAGFLVMPKSKQNVLGDKAVKEAFKTVRGIRECIRASCRGS
ncbi:hypothetical protein K3495_g15507 [Podosphaera aphanis]|nr:hypothetical protein K3495_g15507 [Podosphaera aphanis]